MPSMTLKANIKPNSKLAERIMEEVRRRVRFSERSFSTKRLQWRKAEDEIIAYIPESAADSRRRNNRENRGVPSYTTIKIPYTYAVTMALHTYLCSVFMSRTPVFQFDGRHGEGQQQVLAVEASIDYQMRVGRMLPVLFSWLYDATRYGVAVTNLYWCKEVRHVSEIQWTEEEDGTITEQMVTLEIPKYNGNQLINVSPRDWLPDPRLPMRDFQRGEFCGNRTKLSWLQIKERESAGYYTNVEFIDKHISPRFFDERDDDSQVEKPEDEYFEFSNRRSSEASLQHPDIIPAYEMCIDLIPSDWGVGASDYPEKWMFTVTADWKVVLGAQPYSAYHAEFPFHFIELEPDAYALANRGMPEILSGVQQTMDWLINSHMYNVRASLNNLFFVDPMKVILKDLTDPLPGGMVRVRPGSGRIDDAVKQIPIADVTRNHITDYMNMNQLGEKISGINDQMMGALSQKGRKTATEIRTSSVAGVSRSKVMSEYMSATGFDTLAQQMVQNTQQYQEDAITLKVVGNLAGLAGNEWLTVTPEDIAGFYNFVPVDGTLPLDRFAQANLWKEIMLGLRTIPSLAMQYDIGKIFAWVAQLAGLRNIDKFRLELGSPEQLAQMAASGNVVPIRQGGRGNPANGKQPTGNVGPVPLGGGGSGAAGY